MSAPSPLTVPLESIASCFEGIIPSTICSCSSGGTPNLTYLSIVHLLDDRHVGLSYQFFNKTRTNILENPLAQVLVVSPETLGAIPPRSVVSADGDRRPVLRAHENTAGCGCLAERNEPCFQIARGGYIRGARLPTREFGVPCRGRSQDRLFAGTRFFHRAAERLRRS